MSTYGSGAAENRKTVLAHFDRRVLRLCRRLQNQVTDHPTKANGFSIVQEFADEGMSDAIETTNRPAFAEMVATLHSNGVRTVIVEKLDRLARDLMVQKSALSYLSQNGFTIISVAEPDLMANDPSRTAFRQMMGVFSQYDKSMIVLKLKAHGCARRPRKATARAARPSAT